MFYPVIIFLIILNNSRIKNKGKEKMIKNNYLDDLYNKSH